MISELPSNSCISAYRMRRGNVVSQGPMGSIQAEVSFSEGTTSHRNQNGPQTTTTSTFAERLSRRNHRVFEMGHWTRLQRDTPTLGVLRNVTYCWYPKAEVPYGQPLTSCTVLVQLRSDARRHAPHHEVISQLTVRNRCNWDRAVSVLNPAPKMLSEWTAVADCCKNKARKLLRCVEPSPWTVST